MLPGSVLCITFIELNVGKVALKTIRLFHRAHRNQSFYFKLVDGGSDSVDAVIDASVDEYDYLMSISIDAQIGGPTRLVDDETFAMLLLKYT